MKSIDTVTDTELLWEQPAWSKNEHRLTAGDTLVATLRLPSSWGSLAEAETADARWTFKRTGFWRPKSTVRLAGTEETLATFEPRWTGEGELVLLGGVRYRWEGANLWATKYLWRDALGQELVRFGARSGLLRMSAAVELLPAGADAPDLPLLVTYGYYLLLMSYQDSGAASAATAASTAATAGA